MKFQDTVLSGLRRRYYNQRTKYRRVWRLIVSFDVFLTPDDATLSDSEHDWSNVLVIGEHNQNPDVDCSTNH